MPDDNVIKFRPGPRRKPVPGRPQPPQRPPGQPSLAVAIAVGVVVIAIVVAISWWFGR